MTGKCFRASPSHVVTCARMSFTDQSPVTPRSASRDLDRPAYDSWNAAHPAASFVRSRALWVDATAPGRRAPRAAVRRRPPAPLLRIVEDDARREAEARAQPAHAVAQGDAIGATRAWHRPVGHGKDDGVAPVEVDHLDPRLPAGALLDQRELAAREVPARLREENGDLEREDVLAVE